jgi:hypothetical protein
MITIFCDFFRFSAKKLAFFINTNVMINFSQNLALFWVKNANFFAKLFSENILKIITSVPGNFGDYLAEMIQRKSSEWTNYGGRSNVSINPTYIHTEIKMFALPPSTETLSTHAHTYVHNGHAFIASGMQISTRRLLQRLNRLAKRNFFQL